MIEDEDAIDGVPETDDEESEGLLRQLKAWFRTDREHSADWRKEAKEDYQFRDNDQWSDADLSLLKEQNRPTITFNRILPTVKAVVGIEIGNRRQVRFIPRSEGDAAPNELLSAAADWARDECDAEDEDTDAFADTVVCGMGWTETRIDYEENPDGKMVVERVSPLEMFWDAAARKKNLADARRKARVKTIPLSEAKALYPGFEDDDLDAAWAREALEETDRPNHSDPQDAYQGDENPEDIDRGKEVTIVHMQWWEREPYYRVADPFTGEMKDVEPDEYETLKKRVGEVDGKPLQSVQMTRKVFRQAHIGGKILLLSPAPCDDHFSWECITGERDEAKGVWYGLVRTMKDPQRWANKWLSQGLHILNANAKGGLMAERGAFEDDIEAERTWARPDKITFLSPGALSTPGGKKVEPKPPPTFPTGFDKLLELAISSIRDVSGVNLEMLGLKDTEQAGVLEETRKQAGMTILATMFDSLRRYRKRQGRIILYFLLNYMADGRLIRVVGEEMEQYIPLLKQNFDVEYDVVVDDSPTSPNQKERIWNTLMQVLPMLGKEVAGDDLLELMEYSPLPQNVVQKWKQKAQQKQQETAPKMEEARQLENKKTNAEAEQKLADAMLKMSQVQNAGQEMALRDQEIQVKRQQADNERLQMMMTQQPGPDGQPAQPNPLPMMDQLTQAIMGMMQAQQQQTQVLAAMMQQMNAPKRIVRDEMGRAMGVETTIQ